MYSELHFRTLEVMFKFSYLLGSSPFIWSSRERRVRTSKYSERRGALQGVVALLFTVALGIAAFDKRVGGDIDLFILSLGLFACFALSSIVYSLYVFRTKLAVEYINESMNWITSFQSKNSISNDQAYGSFALIVEQ